MDKSSIEYEIYAEKKVIEYINKTNNLKIIKNIVIEFINNQDIITIFEKYVNISITIKQKQNDNSKNNKSKSTI